MPRKKKFKLTLDNYFSPERPHISRTMITDYLRSPEFYKKRHIDRSIPFKVTMPIQRGSMVDAILTQGKNPYEKRLARTCLKRDDPHLYDAETVIIERQKTRDERFIVSETCWEQAMTVVEEVQRQPYWKQGLKKARFQVVLEGKLEDVLVCGLPDRIDPLGKQRYRMVDLKVVNPIKIMSAAKWLWNAEEMGYIHQAALYQYLFAEEQGIPRHYIEFCHVVAAPVDLGHAESKIFRIPQQLIDKALVEVREALRGIKSQNFEPKLKTWKDAEVLPFVPNVSYQFDFEEDEEEAYAA